MVEDQDLTWEFFFQSSRSMTLVVPINLAKTKANKCKGNRGSSWSPYGAALSDDGEREDEGGHSDDDAPGSKNKSY